ncbi:MAG TPA: 16S rRNA (adenine(1518)-N(6)/adenine(1519)-N(6))-dimethyltransferase RsmA [Epsilonproteobacteria bacterium]|nr:16S rRNA (adenine(1518)-N(6)/adenine(1519)-N(6))-dimethyltransferase RsmA [Campylobacterota bacterium]
MISGDLSKFADKKFGQNFLKNDTYIYKIIQSMPDDDLSVAEIGPGLGDLTNALVKARSVTAFEVDKRLCEHLTTTFKDPIHKGKFELRCGDVLEHWESGSLLNEPYHLVANLPYYIATNIILKALKDELCQSVLVMVQLEVAEKFSADTGEKAFSALSVIAQTVGEAEICFEVEPEAFIPPPKVTSAVLLIRKKISNSNEKFETFLRIAFVQPRKKLSKNLETAFPKQTVATAFETLNLDTNLRPHEVMTSIYHQLFTILKDTLDERRKSKPKSSKARANNTAKQKTKST